MAAERGIEFKVGALLVGALALLGGFIAVLGNVAVGEGFTFYVNYNFSGNLQPGAPVKISGIKVGKVKDVVFLGSQAVPKNKKRVQVQMVVWMDKKVQGTVRQKAEVFINTQGVLGEQYLEVVPGDPESSGPIKPGDTIDGIDPPRTNLIVARLYEFLDSITKLLKDEKVLKDLLTAGASALTTVDKLLLENRESIGKLLVDLDKLTQEATVLVGAIKNGVGDGQKLSKMLSSLEHTTASLSRDIDPILNKTQKALDGVTQLSSIVGEKERKQILAALDSVVKIGESVRRTTGDMERLVAGLRKGEGTAGALLVQDEVYQDLKEMVRDLRRRPWRFFWKE